MIAGPPLAATLLLLLALASACPDVVAPPLTVDDVSDRAKQARELRRTGHPAEALKALKGLPPPAATDSRVLGERVQALMDLGRSEEAVEVLRQLVGERQVALPAVAADVRVLVHQGRAEEALRQADAMLAGAPNHLDLLVGRIAALLALDRVGDAVQAQRTLPDTAPAQLLERVEIDVLLARAAAEAADPELLERAVPKLERALELDPARLAVRLARADALAGFNRSERAQALLDEVLDELQGEPRRSALTRRGDVLRAAQQIEDARDCYEQVLAEVPEHRGAAVGLARCDLKEGQLAQAAVRLEGVLALEPSALDAGLALAEVELARRQPERSVACLERVLATRANHLKALYMLSRAWRLAGQHERAAEVLDRYTRRKQELAGRAEH